MAWSNLDEELEELFDCGFAYKYEIALEKRAASQKTKEAERVRSPAEKARAVERQRERRVERRILLAAQLKTEARQQRQLDRLRVRQAKINAALEEAAFNRRYPHYKLFKQSQTRANVRASYKRRTNKYYSTPAKVQAFG